MTFVMSSLSSLKFFSLISPEILFQRSLVRRNPSLGTIFDLRTYSLMVTFAAPGAGIKAERDNSTEAREVDLETSTRAGRCSAIACSAIFNAFCLFVVFAVFGDLWRI